MKYSHEVIRLAQSVQAYFSTNDILNTTECCYLPWSELNDTQKEWWFEMAYHVLQENQDA